MYLFPPTRLASPVFLLSPVRSMPIKPAEAGEGVEGDGGYPKEKTMLMCKVLGVQMFKKWYHFYLLGPKLVPNSFQTRSNSFQTRSKLVPSRSRLIQTRSKLDLMQTLSNSFQLPPTPSNSFHFLPTPSNFFQLTSTTTCPFSEDFLKEALRET